MTERHPSDDLLALYALGDASPGGALAVAAHLTYCPVCRAKLAEIEGFAAALASGDIAQQDARGRLDNAAGLDNAVPDFAQLRNRLTANENAPRPNPGPLPGVIAEAIGCDFEHIPWRFRLPGVHDYVLSDESSEKIALLRVRPGAGVPQHTHDDEELTVVFDGELVDGTTRYGVGDIAHAGPSVEHHPRAGGDKPCICLTVMSGKGVTFTGRFGRALNLFG